jgi:hypothetical protein
LTKSVLVRADVVNTSKTMLQAHPGMNITVADSMICQRLVAALDFQGS